MKNNNAMLQVNDLRVSFPSKRGVLNAVNGVSYNVCPGEIVGIVGESGSGKSVQARTVMGLLKAPGRVDSGSVTFDGMDMLSVTERQLEQMRGRDISMIFQNPMSSLDPLFTVGYQLIETIRAHEKVGKAEAGERSVQALTAVGIPDGRRIMRQYPHELSGGMRQRVIIAMAMLCSPRLLIADEPTTALDVTIQAQILEILRKMRDEKDTSIIFITHNFGVVADLCDRVYVMYGGMIMEEGTVNDLFYSPAHPYTKGLLKAIPSIDGDKNERLVPIEGTPIDPMNVPQGCVFSERCPHCTELCKNQRPGKTVIGPGHSASCWLLDE